MKTYRCLLIRFRKTRIRNIVEFYIFEDNTDSTMKIILFVLFFYVFIPKVYSQEWVIVDIVNQNSKELSILIDDGGEKINRKKIKNPSIVNLINEYQNNGFTLEKVTSGIELDINGNFPLNNNNRGNNFGLSNLTFSNNNRIMLWFKKQ